MVLKVKKEGVILEPTGLEFENQAVLNPGCVRVGDSVHMFYRAVSKNDFISSIGYCRLVGPTELVERYEKPVMVPKHPYEKRGMEDPRIVFLDGTYYMFYTVYDGKNAMAAYATSRDLKKWEKKGPITPRITYEEAEGLLHSSRLKDRYYLFGSSYEEALGDDVLLWEKDTFMFPKKFGKNFALVHRILPDIQVVYFKDFKELTPEYWKEYLKHLNRYVMLESRYWYESRNIGGGCPPIETDQGWLLIYHAVEDSNRGRVYRAGAALLDKDDPCKIINKMRSPLFSPRRSWELTGDVNNVVFPSGSAVFDDRLYIYYGAADKRIAVASVNLNELVDFLM